MKYLKQNLTGKKFGNWIVLKDLGIRISGRGFDKKTNKKVNATSRYYLCLCKCGTKKEINVYNLINKMTKGCAKCRHERMRTIIFYNKIEHIAWHNILQRCNNKNTISYKKVAKQWMGIHGFRNFLKDMGKRPSPKHSIVRINKDGNYAPGNCRWAIFEVPANGTRSISNELNSTRLAQLTGYSREWIRQLSSKSLRPFIKRTRYTENSILHIFKNEAIEFLKQRKSMSL